MNIFSIFILALEHKKNYSWYQGLCLLFLDLLLAQTIFWVSKKWKHCSYIFILPYSTLSSPPQNDRHFAKLGGGTRQRWFLFSPNLHKKLRKKLSQSNFLIYYDFIKNNSYINLMMEIILELLDPVVMQ